VDLFQILSSAIITFVGFVALLPTRLGERLISFQFDKKLNDLRNDQNRQIEELREKLGHIADRGKRSNEREFIALTAVWESYVTAHQSTAVCAVQFLRFPDLDRLIARRLIRFSTLPSFQTNRK
jgi:hypothetical protein